MRTLDIMEDYSVLCDQLEAFMQEQNRELRNRKATDACLAANEGLLKRLNDALGDLRGARPVEPAERGATVAVRASVLQKLLKLLLLSRETERLLLANANQAHKVAPVRASSPHLQKAYASHSM